MRFAYAACASATAASWPWRTLAFSVRRGEIVGLLGPNGAGKTTTINMVLGILQPSAGTIVIEGIDLARQRSRALAHTNFAAVYAPLPGNLTVDQNLRFFALIYDVAQAGARIDQLLDRVRSAWRCADTRCGLLSSGEQTRLALAKALLNRPRLLLLDEPTASLDPSAADLIRTRIRELAAERGCGILWTSHNMYEVEEHLRPGAVPVARQDPAGRRPAGSCRASTAPPRSRSCSSAWRANRSRSRLLAAAHPSAGGRRDEAAPDRGDRAAPVLPHAQQPDARAADVHLGGDRHGAVGLHLALSEQRQTPPASTSLGACSARCCSGISSSA